MSETRISVGINVSILVILTIFGVLLSLPLRLLLYTNYYTRNNTNHENDTIETTENFTAPETVVIPVDYRKLKQCPKFQYVDRLKSVFRSDYDGNCTYVHVIAISDPEEDIEEVKDNVTTKEESEEAKMSKEIVGEDLIRKAEESAKNRRISITVAGHILVTMLLVSAIAALVEVLRIRFAKDKTGTDTTRKGSIVEIPVQRRFVPRQPLLSQRSFEMQGMHRSALRLLGARPPPLIRRSSFPTQPAKQNASSVSGTPNSRTLRRQSAESDEEIGILITALHHRTRLIRRH